MNRPIEELQPLVGALEDRALEAYRQERQTEAALLAELKELDDLRRDSWAADAQNGARRALGADTAWREWLLQRRAQINLELAQSRGRMGHTIEVARRAFARRQAVDLLAREARDAGRRKALTAEADGMDALIAMSRGADRF